MRMRQRRWRENSTVKNDTLWLLGRRKEQQGMEIPFGNCAAAWLCKYQRELIQAW
jgi:hypothetical protein